MFKSIFSFEGRIRRTEYALSRIITIILIGLIAAAAEGGSEALGILISFHSIFWLHKVPNVVTIGEIRAGGWSFHFMGGFCFLAKAIMAQMSMAITPKAKETMIRIMELILTHSLVQYL